MVSRKRLKDILLSKENHYFIPFVVIVTLLVGLWLLFFAHNSILNWAKAGVEVRQQERKMEQLRGEIDAMDAEIEALTHNRDSAEKFAREQYLFSVPGEDVYVLDEKQ